MLSFYVEHPVVRVERVERDGLFLRVGEVDAVPALRLAVYHLAQPLVRVACIDQLSSRTALGRSCPYRPAPRGILVRNTA